MRRIDLLFIAIGTIVALLVVGDTPVIAQFEQSLNAFNPTIPSGIGAQLALGASVESIPHSTLSDGRVRRALKMEVQNADWGWRQINQGLNGGAVLALAISPDYALDQIVFAGTKGGVFKSTDGGNSWVPFNSGLTSWNVKSIATSPSYTSDHTLFVATEAGVFKSTDGGMAWNPANTGITCLEIRDIDFSPNYASDQTVFAVASGWSCSSGVIYKSTDGGNSWTAITNGIPSTDFRGGLAISPNYTNDHTLFVATLDGGVFKSTDGGSSWTAVNAGLNSLYVTSLGISPQYASDQTLVAIAGDGIYKSTNGGASWVEIYNTTWIYLGSIAISSDGTIFATTFVGDYSGIIRSTDGGTSWQSSQLPNGLYGGLLATSPNYVSDLTVFVGTEAGVFKSTDGGNSWVLLNSGLVAQTVTSVAVSPAFGRDRTMFAGTWGRGVFKSTNGGLNWSRTTLDDPFVNILAISPNYASDRTLFSGNFGLGGLGGLYKSTDGGQNWTRIQWWEPVNGPRDAYSIALSPNYSVDQTLFVGSFTGVYKSVDGGATWQKVFTTTQPVRALALSPSFPSDPSVFAGVGSGGEAGVYRSTDGGASWILVKTGYTNALVISPDYTNDHTVYAAISWTIWRSTDGGNSWTRADTGLPRVEVNALLISPEYATDRTLFASTEEGVFTTRDAGASWTSMNTGLMNLDVEALAMYTTSFQVLLAGTDGSGVWETYVLPGSPTSAIIGPAGGSLVSFDGSTTLSFPGGIFTDTVVVTYIPQFPSLTYDLIGIGHFFKVTGVYSSTGQPVQPAAGYTYTLTVQYTDAEKGPAIENTLALYYWDGSQWVKEPSSVVDTAANTVTVYPNHFSLWAVLGETKRVYLPLVLKGH